MQNSSVRITFYGYPDNDDGDASHTGTNVIAHALKWQGRERRLNADGDPVAGGIGTYDDPITAAASIGNRLVPPGTLVYVPSLQKYLFLEDDCATCNRDAWIDIWMESDAASDAQAVLDCEDTWTGDDTLKHPIVINPGPGLPVDTTPFFNQATGRCSRN